MEDEEVLFETKKLLIKSDRHYTKSHMWAEVLPDGMVKAGITDYACRRLKREAALLELLRNPTVGNEIKQGRKFGTVYGRLYRDFDTGDYEFCAFDLNAPVSGKVVNVNQKVFDRPHTLNEDPYGAGWIVVIKPDDHAWPESLLSGYEYKKLIEALTRSPFRAFSSLTSDRRPKVLEVSAR